MIRTFLYHNEHGAVLFEFTTQAEVDEKLSKGWVDSPAKLKVEAAPSETEEFSQPKRRRGRPPKLKVL